MSASPSFDDAFRSRLDELFRWRRDVRRFRRDPLPPGTLQALVATACLSPSVGLSQPWRFVSVDHPDRRVAVRAAFADANAAALAAEPDERAARYGALKLAGLDDAPCHFAVFCDRDSGRGHGLGRRTMPETLAYSAVLAVGTLWLAARAQGLGLGWVSILDPDRVAAILDVPTGWSLIGYFCLGHPARDSDIPELERAEWQSRCDPDEVLLSR